MLDPTRPLNNSDETEVNHWAHLEAKSDAMTEELVQRLTPGREPSRVGFRLRILCAWAVILGVVVAVVASVLYAELQFRDRAPVQRQVPHLQRAAP